jgi:hypothetical protein
MLLWTLVTPRVLTEALAAGGDEARRAIEAMMPMKKIDIARSRQRGGADSLVLPTANQLPAVVRGAAGPNGDSTPTFRVIAPVGDDDRFQAGFAHALGGAIGFGSG